MKSNSKKSSLLRQARHWAAGLVLASAPCLCAQTIWNGPSVGFYHPFGGGGDQITPGVKLTRGSSGGLYNAETESSAGSASPKDTTWALGSLANYKTLTFSSCPLEAGRNPPSDVGKTYVVHLATENTYFSLTLTNWGGAGGASGKQTFGYTRSTAPPTPVVSLTSPASNAVFAAPANISLAASATVSGGTVTNVQFLANGTAIGSASISPFTLTASNLAAGSYALTAIATASGNATTSAVVNVSVVSPVGITISGTKMSASQLSFNYTANAGLSYVVQNSGDLVNWTSLVTNLAAGSPVLYSNSTASTSAMYYRVGRLPNP